MKIYVTPCRQSLRNRFEQAGGYGFYCFFVAAGIGGTATQQVFQVLFLRFDIEKNNRPIDRL